MFAAVHASDKGHEVHLFEKNEKLGKKLYITGKGRCNITNACDVEELFQAVIGNPKFLYSSFYTYTNQNVIDFFENEGLATKIERGNRRQLHAQCAVGSHHHLRKHHHLCHRKIVERNPEKMRIQKK